MDFEYNEKYFKRHYSAPFYRRYVDFRNRFIKNEITKFVCSGRFLEIGFGDDNLIKFFKNDFEVFGVDISEIAVEKIKEQYEPSHFQICDVSRQKIPFEQKFDVIAALNVIEHLENPKLAFKNIYESLKEKGIFVIYLPTQNNFFSKIQYKIFYDAKEHIFRPSIKNLRNILKDLGLKACKECAASFIPLKINNEFFLELFNLYFGLWQK